MSTKKEELDFLKKLFEEGLITESAYKSKQKDLLSENNEASIQKKETGCWDRDEDRPVTSRDSIRMMKSDDKISTNFSEEDFTFDLDDEE